MSWKTTLEDAAEPEKKAQSKCQLLPKKTNDGIKLNGEQESSNRFNRVGPEMLVVLPLEMVVPPEIQPMHRLRQGVVQRRYVKIYLCQRKNLKLIRLVHFHTSQFKFGNTTDSETSAQLVARG